MKTFTLGSLVATLALFAVGCTGGGASNTDTSNSTGGTSAPGTDGKKLKIGMVFDAGGKGDKSFNDSAFAGLEKAEKELGIEYRTVDSKSQKDFETNISTLAEQGYDLVIAVGITQMNAMNTVAPKFPNTKFAIIDAPVEAKNVRSLLFSEEQGSYLAGIVAGATSKTGKIGFVGGMKIDLILKFEAGFKAGALSANPKIVVLPGKYTESWDDTQAGKENAKALFNEGADIVYHAAGRCGVGVIEAAKEMKKFAIGVDSDQDDVAPGSVLTSMIKRVDVGVFQTIKDVQENKFAAGMKTYDLSIDGVGLSEMKHTKDIVGEATLAKVEAARKGIIDGTIKVPTK
ncbi:MAG TPA: BMP family ABC transporter substrate-binding protein [Fimbriimonas sp.]|nr:BMP family ABC transporter substrate-binding protein [Fimbriimonas sp.]